MTPGKTIPTPARIAKLLAIVAVEPSRRVKCRQPGCGHGVYAAIHVVEENGQLMVLGSTCYAKRYEGAQALGIPAYSAGGSSGAPLTEAQRPLLIDTTAALMDSFRENHEKAMAQANAKLLALRERTAQAAAARRTLFSPSPRDPRPAPPQHPWPWQHHQNTSVAVVRAPAPENQCWVRVQHKDGTQKLVPWPAFDGWDETLPPAVGTPDLAIGAYAAPNIITALQWLRARGFTAPEVSRWPEVLKILPACPEHS